MEFSPCKGLSDGVNIYCKVCKALDASDIRKRRVAAGLCRLCGKCPPRQGKTNCQECANLAATIVRRDKEKILAAYGGVCVCCGEDTFEFLTIDHVNNDGATHRKSITSTFYRWLINNNFPKNGFQILCMNCNFAKGKYGQCPHQRQQNV